MRITLKDGIKSMKIQVLIRSDIKLEIKCEKEGRLHGEHTVELMFEASHRLQATDTVEATSG